MTGSKKCESDVIEDKPKRDHRGNLSKCRAPLTYHRSGLRICIARIGLLLGLVLSVTVAAWGNSNNAHSLAPVPPMGWNDWAHYQCGFTSQTILANAFALVKTGLAAQGYNTVTIDDCWMLKDRDAAGNLQPDPKRFPQGMKAVADAVHRLGLKFGIYEDAGYETCGRYAGSGEPKGGGKDHFLQDAKLFESWGVDYLKLDGCNVYVPPGGTQGDAYRKAYAAQAAALKVLNRPIVFSESAPAYFQGNPDWYDVLAWVKRYGELWREGSDIDTFNPRKPDHARWDSILWNYNYNLPLGRFQEPGNWNDADFIIGGDSGISVPETRSQLALWAMMSVPLILSSDLDRLSPQAIAILSNSSIIAIDQDPLGHSANLIRRTPVMDVLIKSLQGGDYAISITNRDSRPVKVKLSPLDFGFASKNGCRLDAENLWSGIHQSVALALETKVAAHDTEIWRVHPAPSCGIPARTGALFLTANGRDHNEGFQSYTQCLSSSGRISSCTGAADETWTVTASGTLQSGGHCLGVVEGKPVLQVCSARKDQQWSYTLAGNVLSFDHLCLSGAGGESSERGLDGITERHLVLQPCGHNVPGQIWSLPGKL